MNYPKPGYVPTTEDLKASFGMIALAIRYGGENSLVEDLEGCRDTLLNMASECDKRITFLTPPPR